MPPVLQDWDNAGEGELRVRSPRMALDTIVDHLSGFLGYATLALAVFAIAVFVMRAI